MPQISLREKDSLEFALKKLKRLCEKANIWATVRKKESYEKPTTARKRAKMAAVKRQNKKTAQDHMHMHYKKRPAYYSELRTIVAQSKDDQEDHSDQV
jgi:small subunit ribosomal protein S21